jgi:hypothetical protein
MAAMPKRIASEAAISPPPPTGAAMPTAGIADDAIKPIGCRMKDLLLPLIILFFVSQFDFNRLFWFLAFWGKNYADQK